MKRLKGCMHVSCRPGDVWWHHNTPGVLYTHLTGTASTSYRLLPLHALHAAARCSKLQHISGMQCSLRLHRAPSSSYGICRWHCGWAVGSTMFTMPLLFAQWHTLHCCIAGADQRCSCADARAASVETSVCGWILCSVKGPAWLSGVANQEYCPCLLLQSVVGCCGWCCGFTSSSYLVCATSMIPPCPSRAGFAASCARCLLCCKHARWCNMIKLCTYNKALAKHHSCCTSLSMAASVTLHAGKGLLCCLLHC